MSCRASRSNCSVDTITRIAKGFGKLYDFAANALDNEFLFSSQMFLDTHDLWEGKKFNVYQTLKKLSPSCDELISNCCWDGVDYNCMDLFVFEVTIEGFCCIFNFVPTRHNHTISNITTNIIKSNKNKPLKGANLKGLSLTLHHNVSDYFYPLLSSTGATVDIFNANDIPDVNSGGLHYRLIPVGVEIYLKLGATVVQSMPEIKKYSVTKRKCIFPEESRTMLGDKYSYSDCLLDCRIRSIMSLCECIPFTYVTAFNNLTMPQCNLLHTACLDKYQHKWRRYYPYGYHDDDIEIEKQDSLQCENCVPTCHNTFYTVTNDFTYIYQMRNSPTNLSRVHIFFSSVNAKYYKHDVIFYWYEILSNFGGTCGLTMGLSLIGVVEFFYYFSVRLVQNWIFK
ncbi:hypothetical protein FQA39_LY12553 [Lamprigera yunnana]|nr:hypothetical protein FQA39_LY12553 [Lamprigera yunnana]